MREGWFLFAVLFAAVCPFVAHTKGRDPLAWAILGAVFGIGSFIVLLALPNLRKQDEYEQEQMEKEARLYDRISQLESQLGQTELEQRLSALEEEVRSPHRERTYREPGQDEEPTRESL